MMPVESNILLKHYVSCNFILKYYIMVKLGFFHLSRANENLEICMPLWFVPLNESNQFWVNFIGNVLMNGHYLKRLNSAFIENCCMYGYDFCITVTRNEAATRKMLF